MKTYIDKLKTKNRVEYETEDNYYTSYTSFSDGYEYGNVNVFNKKIPEHHFTYHATLDRPYTLRELKKFAIKYERWMKGE